MIEFIYKDIYPLSTIDSPAFLKLVSTLDPHFQPPSQSTITRVLIPRKYEAELDHYKQEQNADLDDDPLE